MDVQFAVDIFNVGLDRTGGNDQLAGNLPVRQAGGEELKDFQFAVGERLN